MADIKYYDVILKPVVTEKSMNAMAEKKYTFLVHPSATKNQIKEAVEKMFEGTKVAKVNTMNNDGKTKRRGMTFGHYRNDHQCDQVFAIYHFDHCITAVGKTGCRNNDRTNRSICIFGNRSNRILCKTCGRCI